MNGLGFGGWKRACAKPKAIHGKGRILEEKGYNTVSRLKVRSTEACRVVIWTSLVSKNPIATQYDGSRAHEETRKGTINILLQLYV